MIDGAGGFGIAVEFGCDAKRQSNAGIGGVSFASGTQLGAGRCGLVHGEQGASVAETGSSVARIARECLAEQCGGRVLPACGGSGIGHPEERCRIIGLKLVGAAVEDCSAGGITAVPQSVPHAQGLCGFDLRCGRGTGGGQGGTGTAAKAARKQDHQQQRERRSEGPCAVGAAQLAALRRWL